ncbi:DUF2339 domain-containing protein [Candidatus Peregrinibacteria bacterium]|uniref:DUF2339 domain-containing protein n=1 Tax=Candidatus Roizmanbacteria bacterium CG22_combo_CG10-13_8_21_14_all_38_20 TaxID=1974862 RepID=A0A2H0BVQ6_9BACT|nr:DUF2339 domain-containing protein [Candidatus Peregrinibacteria bacterium]PIP61684.1 MAG: hypothetical protein COW99_02850 [Candidatus Roizmanbacteria bacterium CG22_combo_CG10-13_8_21_14_all_38_20]PJC31390.1 MAG: hypothetical protein CO050_03395 [Candidatus Roizmanbacteria bacterium CG_4_9_14_0_2_um_filter_38_17]
MGWVVVIVGIVLLYLRMQKLDERITQLEGKTTPNINIAPTEIKSQPTSRLEVQPSGLELFWNWFKADWPLKVGAFLILLGFVWLVSYAFLNNWIGPVGRITLGLIAGLAILVGGERRLSISRTQGTVLVFLGGAVTLITIASAQFVYQMFPAFVALGMSFVVMVLMAVISIRYNDQPLIIAALVAGALGPIITGGEGGSIVALYSYLLVVTVGSLWVVRFKGWRFLVILSMVMISLYSIDFFSPMSRYVLERYTPLEIIQLKFFAVTFGNIFYLASVLAIVRARSADRVDQATAVLVGLFALGWINGIAVEHLRGLLSLSVSLAFMAASYAVFKITKLKAPVYAYAGTAIMLLVAATAYEFEGPVLAIAFALEAAILPIIATRFLNKQIGMSLLFYFILPIIFSLESFNAYAWTNGIWHDDFFTLLAVTFGMLGAGAYFVQNSENTGKIQLAPKALLILGGAYALATTWLTIHALDISSGLSSMLTLGIFTGVGLTAYLKGELDSQKVLERFGLGVIIFVIARLLLVEIWDMVLAWRIITFFVIGTALMATVLLRKRK